MSLMDRLAGKKPASNGTTPNPPAAVPESPELGSSNGRLAAAPPAPPSTPLSASSPSARLTSSMYSTRGTRSADPDKLSEVDQLKIDLHHRLIERLDLEALE